MISSPLSEEAEEYDNEKKAADGDAAIKNAVLLRDFSNGFKSLVRDDGSGFRFGVGGLRFGDGGRLQLVNRGFAAADNAIEAVDLEHLGFGELVFGQ